MSASKQTENKDLSSRRCPLCDVPLKGHRCKVKTTPLIYKEINGYVPPTTNEGISKRDCRRINNSKRFRLISRQNERNERRKEGVSSKKKKLKSSKKKAKARKNSLTIKKKNQKYYKKKKASNSNDPASQEPQEQINRNLYEEFEGNSTSKLDEYRRKILKEDAEKRNAAYDNGTVHWPMRAPQDQTLSNSDRLKIFFGELNALSERIRTCQNCLQRTTDIQPGETLCHLCQKDPSKFHPSNGLQLELRANEEKQIKYQSLLDKWGRLSPCEEALICRVSCMVNVLILPSGGQYAYTGNVINFLSDSTSVYRTLPVNPKDLNIVVYKKRGQTMKKNNVFRCRRLAIKEWLQFLSQYHQFYNKGVRDGTGGYHIPPFKISDIDEEILATLPEDGNLDEFPTRIYDDIIDDNEDQHEEERKTHFVNSDIIGKWLQNSTGGIGYESRQFFEFQKDLFVELDLDEIIRCILQCDDGPRESKISLQQFAKMLQKQIYLKPEDTDKLNMNPSVFFTILREELLDYSDSLDMPITSSSCIHGFKETDIRDPLVNVAEELRDRLDERDEPNLRKSGSSLHPYSLPAFATQTPISEYQVPELCTLAFPTLFPFGTGYYKQTRRIDITLKEYILHIMKFHDGRFATHSTFAYYLLNTQQRHLANQQVEIFLKSAKSGSNEDRNPTNLKDLRDLATKDKIKIAKNISSFTKTLRNTPQFYKMRRKELSAMTEQLGDPHVFATNSHADTHCPILAKFIVKWAQLEGTDKDPFLEDISSTEKHKRKVANVKLYPHLVSKFFHKKTQLYIEHICVGILKVKAYWLRYEWQNRGSVHVHYFLWLDDAPAAKYLQQYIDRQVEVAAKENQSMNDVVQQINHHFLADTRAKNDAQLWHTYASRWNNAWNKHESKPDNVAMHSNHPASNLHDPQLSIDENINALKNKVNRHVEHTSYCLRLKKGTNNEYKCRFGYPLQSHHPNSEPHFYVEAVGKNIRLKLHLPINDPLMNSTNIYQVAAMRSNCDFQPIIDHMAAVEYATKYATKAEKGTNNTYMSILDSAMAQFSTDDPEEIKASKVLKKFIVKSISSRNWSAQEVAHVNSGLPSTWASHDFIQLSTNTKSKVLKKSFSTDADNTPIFAATKWSRYLERFKYVTSDEDIDFLQKLSFTAFYKEYLFWSKGRKGGIKLIKRNKPTIVVTSPLIPKFWGKPGHVKRSVYCEQMLVSHKPFKDMDDFNTYLETFDNDYITAYESFANSPDAPLFCKDDLINIEIPDDGDEISHYNAYSKAPEFDFGEIKSNTDQDLMNDDEEIEKLIANQQTDWKIRTTNISPDVSVLKEMADFIPKHHNLRTEELKREQNRTKSCFIDLDNLNNEQRLAHDIVFQHFNDESEEALRLIVFGTAGSGKSFTIDSLRQMLGNSCVVLAPTGVAAQNIGAATIHSFLKIPINDINRSNISLSESAKQEVALNLTGIKYIIIDEMSMVGRRMLGHIDYRLREATGVDEVFAGLNIILVGDLGQLPPVKDKTCYDTSRIYKFTKNNQCIHLSNSPQWEKRGVDAYNTFNAAVRLKHIMRVVGNNPEVNFFKKLQLRARDGLLSEEDWNWIRKKSLNNLPDDSPFTTSGDVYNLVTTRSARDELNKKNLHLAIKRDTPAIAIKAINSDKHAHNASVDDFSGLHNTLYLTIGAPVMINITRSLPLGLLNGTIGTLYDVLVDESGRAVILLLLVKKETTKTRGYTGPSYPIDTPEVIPPGYALVPLSTTTVRLNDRPQSERTQFPITLAWAITIHKSQGLTLPYVVLDAGKDEHSTGLFFVGMSRVKHPDNLVFNPTPSLERVTKIIARKAMLFKRKQHEIRLNALAEYTINKFRGLATATKYPPKLLGYIESPPKNKKHLSSNIMYNEKHNSISGGGGSNCSILDYWKQMPANPWRDTDSIPDISHFNLSHEIFEVIPKNSRSHSARSRQDINRGAKDWSHTEYQDEKNAIWAHILHGNTVSDAVVLALQSINGAWTEVSGDGNCLRRALLYATPGASPNNSSLLQLINTFSEFQSESIRSKRYPPRDEIRQLELFRRNEEFIELHLRQTPDEGPTRLFHRSLPTNNLWGDASHEIPVMMCSWNVLRRKFTDINSEISMMLIVNHYSKLVGRRIPHDAIANLHFLRNRQQLNNDGEFKNISSVELATAPLSVFLAWFILKEQTLNGFVNWKRDVPIIVFNSKGGNNHFEAIDFQNRGWYDGNHYGEGVSSGPNVTASRKQLIRKPANTPSVNPRKTRSARRLVQNTKTKIKTPPKASSKRRRPANIPSGNPRKTSSARRLVQNNKTKIKTPPKASSKRRRPANIPSGNPRKTSSARRLVQNNKTKIKTPPKASSKRRRPANTPSVNPRKTSSARRLVQNNKTKIKTPPKASSKRRRPAIRKNYKTRSRKEVKKSITTTKCKCKGRCETRRCPCRRDNLFCDNHCGAKKSCGSLAATCSNHHSRGN